MVGCLAVHFDVGRHARIIQLEFLCRQRRAYAEQKREVITHPGNREVQAPTVLRIVPNGLAPVRRAVSTTVRIAASPSAAHIAR